MAILRGTRWQADAKVDGRRVRPAFATKEEAEAFERDPKGYAQVKPTVGPMFRHGFDLIYRGTKNEIEADRLTGKLIQFFGRDTPCAYVTTTKVQDYIAGLLGAGKSKCTVNKHLSVLSRLVKHCHERKALAELPVIKFYSIDSGRIRFLTEVEERTIISNLKRPEHQALSHFLLYTGCRYGEAEASLWQDYQDDRVTFWRTKGDKPRTIPLTGYAGHAVSYMRSGRKGNSGGPWSSIDYDRFIRDWRRARSIAGLEGDDQVVPYALRHTCASRLVQRGASIVVVKEWLGHSSIEQTMTYAHLAPTSLFSVAHLLGGSVELGVDTANGHVIHTDPVAVPESVTLCQTTGELVGTVSSKTSAIPVGCTEAGVAELVDALVLGTYAYLAKPIVYA